MTDPAHNMLWPSLIAAFAVLLAVGTAGASTGSRVAGPLRGVPLGDSTGLHLLVSDIPPFVFDVDTGRVTRLRGAATPPPAVLWVTGVAGRAGVVAADNLGDAKLTAVRGKARRLSPLGTGRNVWPAPGGRAVWIESRVGSRCTLRQVALDGRTLRARRSVPCASATAAPVAGSTGLVWTRTRVIDPSSGATAIEAPLPIVAVAGDELVLEGPGEALTLMNAKTGSRRQLPWPSDHGVLDTPAVSGDARYVALAFANPSLTSPAGQFSDLWLLDTATAELKQLPGMPAFVALKATSMAWTPDGRLVLLAESGGKDMVAVWKPGQAKLGVKTVRLPERDGSSDTFALIP